MQILADIIEHLKKANLSRAARETGISRQTLTKLRDGVEDNPTIKTVQALAEYFNL